MRLPRRRITRAALAALVVAFAAIAVGEALGWPFLRPAVERWLGARLERTVLVAASQGDVPFRLGLIGGLSLRTPRLVVGSPAWSRAAAMLEADDAQIALRYGDLLSWRRGGPLHVDRLQARRLALRIERRPDGRASWQFGARDDDRPSLDGVVFGTLRVDEGRVWVDDAPLELALRGEFAWRDGLVASAEGRYRGLPAQASVRSSAAGGATSQPVASDAAQAIAVRVSAGRAKLEFDGRLSDPFGARALEGRYRFSGPSLAAAGAAFGITLPTTPAFSMEGTLDGSDRRWHTAVSAARIGASRLAGDFVLDRRRDRPLLSGRLSGSMLRLADLGPAVGLPTPETPAPRRAGRVLPDRAFNLPSLRRMDADVQVRIERLETGHAALQDIRPLHAHLRLADGVLELSEIDARLAQGRLDGRIRLDGTRDVAQWLVELRLRGLVLEQWLARGGEAGPPPATGRIAARLNLTGQGRSTAQLLASADGRAVLHWTRGTLSHRVVEAAGIDLAESLGVMLRGDRPLAVNCGAADLRIVDGRATPTLMLVDTDDSTLQVEGALSLATERLDLVLRTRPKDFSLATLRSPLHVEGSFADPQVRLDRGGVLRRALPAALLAAVNPFAALLPLIDPGEDADGQALSACRAVAQAPPARTPRRR